MLYNLLVFSPLLYNDNGLLYCARGKFDKRENMLGVIQVGI